jgi:hypothetical protein
MPSRAPCLYHRPEELVGQRFGPVRVVAYLGRTATRARQPQWQVQYRCGHQGRALMVTLRQYRQRPARRCHRCHYEHRYTWQGRTQAAMAWARELHLYYPTLMARLHRGVPFARAIDPQPLPHHWMRKPLRLNGELVSQAEAARRLGLSREAIRQRLRHGWRPRRAYTQPRKAKSLDPRPRAADNASVD